MQPRTGCPNCQQVICESHAELFERHIGLTSEQLTEGPGERLTSQVWVVITLIFALAVVSRAEALTKVS